MGYAASGLSVLVFVGAAHATSIFPFFHHRHHHHHHHHAIPASWNGSSPGSANATEHWIKSRIDHFTSTVPPGGNETYAQRYFVYDAWWKEGHPIFFYCGNEADVELFVNSSGLMWERAEEFKAMLVWAEHRYYGASQPFGSLEGSSEHLEFLSVEQAMYDYAALIRTIKLNRASPDSPVIAFGGSYGGMLAAWLRFKWPQVVDGAIAASAPIWSFEGEDPACEPNFFARGVTYALSEAGGVSSGWCEANFREAFANERLEFAGSTAAGRAALTEAFRLCAPLPEDDDAGWTVTFWLNSALTYMAMGNYPYPSSYILLGEGVLPAFPVAAACDAHLAADLTAGCGVGGPAAEAEPCAPLFEGLAAFVGAFYNSSGDVECYDLSSAASPEARLVDALWGYQYCTEIFQLFGQDGVNDVFWDYPWNATAEEEYCAQTRGTRPRAKWAENTFGDHGDWARSASNIVFSNGELDPWAGGGVNANLSESLLAIHIPRAAHHLDLMFSDPTDSDALRHARDFEVGQVRKWIKERNAFNAS